MTLFAKTDEPAKHVADFKIGEKVDWYYRLLDVSKKRKKDGGEYLTLVFMDKTGKIPAKIWENTDEVLKVLQAGRIYRVNGEVTEFGQKKEIRVLRLRPMTDADREVDETDYIETASFDTTAVFGQMIASLESEISNPFLGKLVEEFVREYGDVFRNHYGAQKIHHAYLGGLLEHTAALIKTVFLIAPIYGFDKELLAIGALLHDIGKVAEFKIHPAPETTLEGGLLGHIVLGNTFFLELKNRIKDFPEELTVKIQHLIISHHGEKEFGSPEVPKTPEAYALHILDMLDSRMNIFRELARTGETGKLFSDFSNSLGTRILIDKK
jgi:3'-5' exoribonuclease